MGNAPRYRLVCRVCRGRVCCAGGLASVLWSPAAAAAAPWCRCNPACNTPEHRATVAQVNERDYGIREAA
ncbi:MAG TPA: hypothetical protein VHA75_01085 [Rugosimonospora sp.]|nr:hypothetical protein [Rugosimonospora sp.]